MTNDGSTTGGSDIKNQKTGLIVFGILEIILGSFFTLMIPLMIIGMVASADTPLSASTLIPCLVFYGLLATWFIWMGIGSILARRWARALWLISSWLWLICGIIGLVFILVIMPDMYSQMDKSGHIPQQIVAVIKYVSFGFMLIFYIIIPGALVLFYGSKHTKMTCEQWDSHVRWTDKCPLPVLALSLMFGCWAAGMLPMGFYGWTIPFFGFILNGFVGAGVVLGGCLLCSYVSWGMYRLKISAWWCAILLTIAWGVSTVIPFSRLSLMEFYEKKMIPAQSLELFKQFATQQAHWMILFNGLWFAIVLAYLLYTRKYFTSPTEQQICSPGERL